MNERIYDHQYEIVESSLRKCMLCLNCEPLLSVGIYLPGCKADRVTARC